MKKTTIIKNKEVYGSYFDKTIYDFIKTQLKFYAMCFGTLGFAYPWALCMKYRATYHHTVICNKRLKFIGNPNELIFAWIWWWFLSVISCGLFAFIAQIKMEQWIISNVIFEEIETE